MKIVRLRPWVIMIAVLIFLTGIVYYSYEVFIWYLHIKENKEITEEIEKHIKITTEQEKNQYLIDFESLKKMNPDTIAFIKVNNTNINYIVVKGKNNNYYLNHNFEKKWNVAGWIFADYRNQFDDTDKNRIIYGHNTKDGSMFDTLIHVLDKEWYEEKENHLVTLITEKETVTYQVFSTYSIIPEEYYITTNFKNDIEYFNFLKTLQQRSIYNYGVELTEKDKILTLSSCIGEGQKRVVLHAKLLEKEKKQKEELE